MIGPVSETTRLACARHDRVIDAVSNANDIFFHLDGRRVYYDSAEARLYFINAPETLVLRTIHSVLAGCGSHAVIEQLHLDSHRLFNGACRVALVAEQANAVLLALRLVGVRATVR